MVVLHRAGSEVARWGIPLDDRSDFEVIDELAKVALTAKRSDETVIVHVFCPRLASVIDLAGLRGALGAEGFGALEDAGSDG